MHSKHWLAPAAAAAMILTPATAFASGGWEGFFTLVFSALFAATAFVVAIIQGIVLAAVKSDRARRMTGTLTLVIAMALGLLELLVILAEIADVIRRPSMWVTPLIAVAGLAICIFLALRLRRRAPGAAGAPSAV